MDLKKAAEDFPRIGLGVLMVLAGVSKFFIIEYWTGYEPQIVLSIIPLNAEQLVLVGGVFESVLGSLLLTGRKVEKAALVTGGWLGLITLQMVNLGLWDLAIRDLGLTFYAFSVYLLELRK